MSSSDEKSRFSDQIKAATHELLKQPDWGANTVVCDILNASPALCEEGARVIKKRLTQKTQDVALLTLTLLDAVMKNCKSFHAYAANEEFLKCIEKVIEHEKSGIFHRKQSNDEIRLRLEIKEKALVMVQAWAQSFDRNQYPGFGWLYNKLRSQGYVFPLPDKDEAAPVFTPPVKVPKDSQQPPPKPKGLKENYSDPECIAIIENAQVLYDMLTASSERDDLQKNELVQTLITNVRTAQNRTLSRLQSGKDSDVAAMDDLLRVNDVLLDAIKYYNGLAGGFMTRLKPEDEKETAPAAAEAGETKVAVSNSPKVVKDLFTMTPRSGGAAVDHSPVQKSPGAPASHARDRSGTHERDKANRPIPVLSPPPSNSGHHRPISRGASTTSLPSAGSPAQLGAPGGAVAGDILNIGSAVTQPARSSTSAKVHTNNPSPGLPPGRAPTTILDDIFDPLAAGSVVDSGSNAKGASYAGSGLPSYPVLKSALSPRKAAVPAPVEPAEEDDPFMSLASRDARK